MSMTTPLRIILLFHPDSPAAVGLAEGLFEALSGRVEAPGLRVPIEYRCRPETPRDPLDLTSARHTLVVALVDSRMSRHANDGPGTWKQTLVELRRRLPVGDGPHALLPVALDRGAFDLDPVDLRDISFVRLDAHDVTEHPERLLFHVCAMSLRLVEGTRSDPTTDRPLPVRLFISHAKVDLPGGGRLDDDDPVTSLLFVLEKSPVDAWYDAKQIPIGGRFREEIERGILSCSALIAVVTDNWSSREWCRREMLEAKAARRPIIVIDHITREVPRLFPYLGNAPTIRWTGHATARRVLTRALREALRHRVSVRAMAALAGEHGVVFGSKPELLSLAGLPEGKRRVVYPDPPIGHEELTSLTRAMPSIELITPMNDLVRRAAPDTSSRIALSMSPAPDALDHGTSPAHLAVLADDLSLYLMLAGFTLAYGGSLLPGPDARDNLTLRLIEMARSYSPLAARLGVRPYPEQALVRNYVPWPVHCGHGAAQDDEDRGLVRLHRVGMPPDLRPRGHRRDGAFFEPVDTHGRYAWARGLTHMRETMRDAADITARVVVGGRLTGYKGRYPGVLEEALLDIRAGRAVYLLGSFGGAGRWALDALRGRVDPASGWTARQNPSDEALRAMYASAGQEMMTVEAVADELARRGRSGLGCALNNGLDDVENEALSRCTDPREIVERVAVGLRRAAERA